MPNPAFFKDAFDRVSGSCGYIGDPNGIDAYGYIRVSSDGQAEEGRTGLPRQIKHIHEVAAKEGFRVPWDMVYADDESGFTLERPALEQLLTDVGKKDRKANMIFLEHLDRLSRDVDWHQGYLLHLFQKKHKIDVRFWKQFGSRVERVVMGAISQDGMERSKAVMVDGMREKAESGRVTAKSQVAYGYRKVDSSGNVSEKTKRDTHYGICEEEAVIVRYIYEEIGYRGRSLRSLSHELSLRGKSPKNGKQWGHKTIALIIKNPAYRGKFAAYRQKMVIEEKIDPITGLTRKVKKAYFTPEEEWVYVDVPAIVSEELWNAANKTLEKNRQMASRNAKTEYLLSGLLRCSIDNFTWHGYWKKDRYSDIKYYDCATRHEQYRSGNTISYCGCKAIRAEILETAVWKVVSEVLDNPQILLNYLDIQFNADHNQSIFDQIDFCENEIKRFEKEDRKALDLYNADGYNAEEYAGIHKGYKQQIATISKDIVKLKSKVLTAEKVEQQKQFILEMTARARAYKFNENPPFEVKRALIKIAVDTIFINQKEGKFTIEGEINGTWPLSIGRLTDMQNGEDGIECISSILNIQTPIWKNT